MHYKTPPHIVNIPHIAFKTTCKTHVPCKSHRICCLLLGHILNACAPCSSAPPAQVCHHANLWLQSQFCHLWEHYSSLQELWVTGIKTNFKFVLAPNQCINFFVAHMQMHTTNVFKYIGNSLQKARPVS